MDKNKQSVQKQKNNQNLNKPKNKTTKDNIPNLLKRNISFYENNNK